MSAASRWLGRLVGWASPTIFKHNRWAQPTLRRRKRVQQRRVLLEQLEDRTLLAALPPQGLVSWFRAEGDAKDFLGSNNGTLMNGATFAAGKVGQAFKFDGTDDVVEVANESAFDFDRTNSFTIEAWINTT